MKLVLATNNKHKVEEIKKILGNKFEEILTLKDLNIDVDVEETGTTFAENATLKASAICKLTNLPALADDSGLSVDALNGEPGVYSARYAGIGQDDNANINKLLEKMENQKNKDAHFTSAIVLCFPDGKIVSSEGSVYGKILDKRQGENGFGYDPVFYSNDLAKSFAVATSEEKNSISHRAIALRELVKQL